MQDYVAARDELKALEEKFEDEKHKAKKKLNEAKDLLIDNLGEVERVYFSRDNINGLWQDIQQVVKNIAHRVYPEIKTNWSYNFVMDRSPYGIYISHDGCEIAIGGVAFSTDPLTAAPKTIRVPKTEELISLEDLKKRGFKDAVMIAIMKMKADNSFYISTSRGW